MLGSFYEKAWDLGRRIDARVEYAAKSFNNIRNKNKNRPKKMHLRESEEAVRVPEAVDAGSTPAAKKMFEDEAKLHPHPELEVKNANNVEISISSDGLEVDSVLDAFFASWILFLHRYQRDALDQLSWTSSISSVLSPLSTSGIYFPSLHSVADLLSAVRNLRPNFKLTDLATLPTFSFQDGVNNEASIIFWKQFCGRH
jgi:hypothetical protein